VRSVGQSGRTILFVSHNMAALRQVCRRAIALESGGVVADGEINDVADNYLASVQVARATKLQAETPTCIVRDVQIRSLSSPVIKTFDRVEVRVRFTAKTAMLEPGIYVSLLTLDGQRIAGVPSNDLANIAPLAAGESVEMGFVIEDFPLLAGAYDLEVQLRDAAEQKYEFVPALFRFTVVETPVYGKRKIEGGWFGYVGLQARAFSSQSESVAQSGAAPSDSSK
jgi:lipopolysaccharide transport system ATP-binding protein